MNKKCLRVPGYLEHRLDTIERINRLPIGVKGSTNDQQPRIPFILSRQVK
jgi:hypothetical protein